MLSLQADKKQKYFCDTFPHPSHHRRLINHLNSNLTCALNHKYLPVDNVLAHYFPIPIGSNFGCKIILFWLKIKDVLYLQAKQPKAKTHRWDEFSVTMPHAGYARKLYNEGYSVPSWNRCRRLCMEENKPTSLWCDTLCVELICFHTGDAALVSYSLAKVVNPHSSGKFAANLEALWILIGFSTLNSHLTVLFHWPRSQE